MAAQELITAGASLDRYRISEYEGESGALLWVRLRVVQGPVTALTGQVYWLGEAATCWGFHSRHATRQQAEQVRASLEYDMEQPS